MQISAMQDSIVIPQLLPEKIIW